MPDTDAASFVDVARARLCVHLTGQVRACLEALKVEQIWWRPNDASNAIGNLVLHCAGSTRFYIGHVIGGTDFVRDRRGEFDERRELPPAGQRYVGARVSGQLDRETVELVADRGEVGQRIPPAGRRYVDHVHQHLRPFEVAEKAMAESVAGVRALDETRNVGQHEAPLVVEPHDSQMRIQGRERIVGHLRARCREAPHEGRLADIGVADETGVGQELELQPQRPSLARLARLDAPRRAIGRGREVLVASPATPAGRDAHFLADGDQVGQLPQPVVGARMDERAGRHLEHQIGARPAGAVRPLAVAAPPGSELGMETVVHQRVAMRAGAQYDRAAAAAVAAVRPAAGDVLLAPEAHTPVAAVAGRNLDVDFVDEHAAISWRWG